MLRIGLLAAVIAVLALTAPAGASALESPCFDHDPFFTVAYEHEGGAERAPISTPERTLSVLGGGQTTVTNTLTGKTYTFVQSVVHRRYEFADGSTEDIWTGRFIWDRAGFLTLEPLLVVGRLSELWEPDSFGFPSRLERSGSFVSLCDLVD